MINIDQVKNQGGITLNQVLLVLEQKYNVAISEDVQALGHNLALYLNADRNWLKKCECFLTATKLETAKTSESLPIPEDIAAMRLPYLYPDAELTITTQRAANSEELGFIQFHYHKAFGLSDSYDPFWQLLETIAGYQFDVKTGKKLPRPQVKPSAIEDDNGRKVFEYISLKVVR